MLSQPTSASRLPGRALQAIRLGKSHVTSSLIANFSSPGGLLKAILSSVLLFGLAASGLSHASDEDAFLGEFHLPSEKSMGLGQSALWTLPDVAMQYPPLNPTPLMKEALQAQQEGRFLDALIRLDDASKSEPVGTDVQVEITLLRASFLLQDNQSEQALALLTPLRSDSQHGADAYALIVMAQLQLGKRLTLEAAMNAQDYQGGVLPHLAQSYALQSVGHLTEASDGMRAFNAHAPQSAVALAREAELALMSDRIASARSLLNQAQAVDALQPYVIAVSGLAYLIDGKPQQAKVAFEIALKRDSKDAKALLGLGLAEIKLGNFMKGQKMLQAADEAEPNNALILTYLGRSQQQSGQAGAARESWRSAQQADPKDPIPWLYQAQAELQANQLVRARESLRQAQDRMSYRSVYRSDLLLRDDAQLLQANLAEIQRQSGLEGMAFHTLSDSVGEKNSSNLRNQAEVLQGQRFGESARRSLLLQSLFNEKPGSIPPALDSYSDGLGESGASIPQHSPVSGLNPQQLSYSNYDELFSRRTKLEAEAMVASKNTDGEQIRLGVGNDTFGLGLAGLQLKSNGFAPFENLDTHVAQATVQWRPTQFTQAFVSSHIIDAQHGETFFPTLPWASNAAISEHNQVTHLGLRHSLSDHSELRALWSKQRTEQTNNYEYIFLPFSYSINGSSESHSVQLQYKRSGADNASQLSVQKFQGDVTYPGSNLDLTINAQQLFFSWQQVLKPQWQIDARLGYGKNNMRNNMAVDISTHLERWLPGLGVIYTPNDATHIRLAAWQGMGNQAVGDATLVPTSLAGALLDRNDNTGKLVRSINLSGDKQLSSAWFVVAQAQQSKTEEPHFDSSIAPGQLYLKYQVDESKLKLHWQPEGKPWAMGLAFDYERIKNDPLASALDTVNEQAIHTQQLDMRWFASEHLTTNLVWGHHHVIGTQQMDFDANNNPILLGYQDGFNQVDAYLDWRLVKSSSFTVGVRNATNETFKYMDTDKLNPRFSNGRLVYAKFKFAW